MKITKQNLKLSGKGAIVSQELLHENMKIITSETQFHELVVIDNSDDGVMKRVGWLIPNAFEIMADFTAHSDRGARGKSTQDSVERAIIFDRDSLLDSILPEVLVDIDTSESQELLDKILGDESNFKGNINLDLEDGEKDGLVVLSPASGFVFIQAEDASIRIHKTDGVYVLKRGEKDRLIMIDHKDGVNITGDKEIHVGPGGLVINGEPFDIGAIVGSALGSIGPMLAGLGALGSLGNMGNINFSGDFSGMHEFEAKMEKFGEKMEKMGEKFAQKFGKNFAKNFEMNFGSDSSFDDEPGPTYDVDIDYEE